ncbi:phage holin family protein [Planomonospora sp. ID91781]|uniref:Membrane protein n=3 Tax=Planomonospora TaxID=1998 RepID=A0A161LVG0_9ACTN|nr:MULTISPECIES: phage holin family protein [Planomonospora]MBG0824170.1 phage holin family protein [Planomonospora sp. ID91781]GAT65841.1 membrane protein [Planomonospora sphaerica]GGK78248.1 membrane protein [Planomonospora parontospora]GII10352.1 membrane protein [Planomonospora parontospora subsp. parontospora]
MANSTKDGLSTGELIKQISEEVSRLVRDEIRLAKIELGEKSRHAGRGAGMVGGAGVIALFGGGALVAAVILLLAQAMPAWAAAAVVGAVLLLAAAVLGLRGKRQVSAAGSPAPQRTIRSVKNDIDAVKERAHR